MIDEPTCLRDYSGNLIPKGCHSGGGRNLFKNGLGLQQDPGLRRDERRLFI